jgi:ATP-dependent Lon protease
VILPSRNRKDVQNDLPESVRKEIQFAFVATIDEALEEVWSKEIWAAGVDKVVMQRSGRRGEARL